MPTKPLLTSLSVSNRTEYSDTGHGDTVQNSRQGQLFTLPALFIGIGSPKLAVNRCSMFKTLHKIGQNLPKPRAIIVLSAQWQSAQLEISSTEKPLTWHDFSHESEELYKFEYPASGEPNLAYSIVEQLSQKNIPCRLNPIKAYDKGVWVPLSLLYPNADVPVIQISLPKNFDAYHCYQLGAIFANLRQEQVMLIGSGYIDDYQLTQSTKATSKHSSDTLAFKTWLLRQLKTDIPKALDWQTHIHRTDADNTHLLLPLFFALGCGQRVTLVHESKENFHDQYDHKALANMDILRFD